MNLNTDTKLFLGIGVITVLIIIVASFFLTQQQTPKLDKPSVDTNILVRDDSQIQSSPSSTLTLVEFADFQCPSCGQAHSLVKNLLEKYKGHVNYVFRHFPLPQHANGFSASIAAEAAGDQGKFWQMHNILFTNQTEWSDEKNPNPIFESYAKDLKLDIKKFAQALKNKLHKDKINRDLADGKSVGVNSTPTFFLNGQRMQNFTDIETIIKSEIKK